jgi:predicted 3-demethylubiquinone-9 3-methyltransferase (glyoxalase superfamily)
MATLTKINPCLWFDSEAEEAANFYVSIFDDARIVRVARYSGAGVEVHHRQPGSVMTVEFVLEGQSFTALNGGPIFKFNEAVSLMIMCETQAEIDRYWSALTKGGDPKAQQCGWLKDRFGLSWQVVPRILPDLLGDHESKKTERAMAAMMEMKKFDIAALERAYRGDQAG